MANDRTETKIQESRISPGLKVSRFDRFYNYWVHDFYKSSIEKEHLSRQYLINLFPGLIGYIIFLSLTIHIDYLYGIIAATIGIVSAFVSAFLLRYNTNELINTQFGLISFFLPVLIAGIGAGGIGSIFSLPFIWLIWVAYIYGIKSGRIWTAILIACCIFFLIIELTGNRIPLSFHEDDLRWFGIGYALLCFLIASSIFANNRTNEARLIAKLEESQSLILKQQRLASLGQLAAGIAHEINNPLNSIAGNAKALEYDLEDLRPLLEKLKNPINVEADLDDMGRLTLAKEIDLHFISSEMNTLLSSIQSGTHRIGNIVKGLRSFISSGNESLTECDMIQLTDEVCSIMANEARLNQVLIDNQLDKIPPILGHRGKILEVLIHVIRNAIDAIDDGGTIFINEEIVGDQLHISIQDTGRGISEENLSRIFEPFFSTKEIGSGTGLGLYVSYHIMKEHSGEIVVSSEESKGTKVTLRFPMN